MVLAQSRLVQADVVQALRHLIRPPTLCPRSLLSLTALHSLAWFLRRQHVQIVRATANQRGFSAPAPRVVGAVGPGRSQIKLAVAGRVELHEVRHEDIRLNGIRNKAAAAAAVEVGRVVEEVDHVDLVQAQLDVGTMLNSVAL